MNCYDFNRIADSFGGLNWQQTKYKDVEWFYAEERRYIVHIKERKDGFLYRPEQYRIIKAKNPDQAIELACFDMGLKAREVAK